MNDSIFEKLTVLGDAAKYDASCSTSGVARANVGRMGNASCAGICHSWAADGRCISLLKVLYSNDCVYDCKYCVNRRSADTARRTFEPKELADLTMEFYRRNYIEGLFLSSAVFVSPDHTMERVYEALYLLREVYGFAGYIHAKVVPGISPELLYRLGLVSDRLSVNIEFPSEESLAHYAPQKKIAGVLKPMRQIALTQAEQKTLKAPGLMGQLHTEGRNLAYGDGSLSEIRQAAMGTTKSLATTDRRKNYKEKFAPAGQTTQMIIGASPESDRQIIKTSEALYRRFSLKRVYFSAYIPVAESPDLPALLTPPPLKREHRLYQADWLLRFYGFTADEILSEENPNLDTELDPKIIWALRNLAQFPIEVNKASHEELLRIPGVGNISARRILRQRKIAAVKYEDLKKMGVVLKRARFFLTCSGKYYGGREIEPVYIRDRVLAEGETYLTAGDLKACMTPPPSPQISMFDALPR